VADKKKAQMESDFKRYMDAPTDSNILKADRINVQYEKRYGRPLKELGSGPDYAGVMKQREADARKERKNARIKNMRRATRRMRSR
jgi:hypothetical protein